MGSWVGEGFVIVGVEIGVCFSLCDMGLGNLGLGILPHLKMFAVVCQLGFYYFNVLMSL